MRSDIMSQSKKMSQKEAYELVISDADEIHDFVMNLSDDSDLTTVNLPAQLKIYVDSSSKNNVVCLEKEKAQNIAVALGGTGLLASALGTIGVGSSIVGAAGLIAGSFFPPLIPIALLGGAAGLVTKKIINRNKFEKASNDIKESREKLCHIMSERAESYYKNQLLFKQKLKEKAEKLSNEFKDASKKVAIMLDDAANTNVNKRIQQYNQIVLDQYNNQAELANEFNEIATEYNKLLAENERLNKEIEILQHMIVGVDVQNSYISGALANAEGKK